MTRENPCEAVLEALLDPSAAPPPGMDAHLAACPDCRRARDAHRAAERLGAPALREGRAIRMDDVVARVRSRRRGRAAIGAAAAACAAVALALLARAPARPHGPGDDLFAVADSVDAYARRELASEDPVLLAAAPLAGWLAPPPRRPLGCSSLAAPPPGAHAGGL